MGALQDISDIFSILHDGTIVGWKGDKELLTLKVNCLYLAERIDKTFESFYVELINIDVIELDPWTFPDSPTEIKTQVEVIFREDLEIMSADIHDNAVIITCHQDDKNIDHDGGNLKIVCSEIKVYDQNKNILTIDEFDEICKSYWDEWSQKTNQIQDSK